jgi:hypothetical protein
MSSANLGRAREASGGAWLLARGQLACCAPGAVPWRTSGQARWGQAQRTYAGA